MLEKIIIHLITEHSGKTLGVILGLIAGIIFLNYGFWRSIFIILCILIGYFIGKNLDDRTNIEGWIKRIFKSDQF